MKKNPVATITFSNGSVIQIELYPDIAPNAVTSFIYLAKQGVYDHTQLRESSQAGFLI